MTGNATACGHDLERFGHDAMSTSRGPLPTHEAGRTIDLVPVHVDPALPVHPFTVDDVHEMVRVGIIDPDAHVELLDGVLAE